MTNKTCLLSGCTGQDAPWLAKLLLEKGYKVFGIKRRSSNGNVDNLVYLGIEKEVELIDADLTDSASLYNAIKKTNPDEVYNLAAQSFVGASWDNPIMTAEVNSLGTLKFLEAVRKLKPDTKFYQASTSEMFGNAPCPQNESTPLNPRSPYGVAKLYAHHITKNYRESYGMFTCCGILFNHESEIRGKEFVTRKITDEIARIKKGLSNKLYLGNIESKRDWGHAEDYVEAMWLMMQQDKPDDYVVATGETHTIKDFLSVAFNHVGLNWDEYVEIDPKFYRPAELHFLQGDYTKAKEVLNWSPKINFNELVIRMVDADLKRYHL